MKKNTIYLTTYKEDYIWHKIKPPPGSLAQKASCKKLSIPKFIRKKYQKLIQISSIKFRK